MSKLTLSLDAELIAIAKRYAAESGTSVSALVAAYFALLDEPTPVPVSSIPVLDRLRGCLAGLDVDRARQEHLSDRHPGYSPWPQ